MFKISQFSKLTGMTVKALRYYDDEGILQPSFRNVENQYRYYNESDLQRAWLIKTLRTFDFSMMEIKDCLETIDSEEDITYILQEKVRHIEHNISKEKELIQSIKDHITTSETYTPKNPYPIDIVDVEEIDVASIRFMGKYSDLDKYIPKLFKAVKNNSNGKHFNCYYDEAYCEDADIELCVPIKKWLSDDVITWKRLSKIKAIHTIHYGSYDTLFLAYKALFEYVNQHNIKLVIPSRELYTKGPGMIFRGNPAHYVTEILLPFEINGKDIV